MKKINFSYYLQALVFAMIWVYYILFVSSGHETKYGIDAIFWTLMLIMLHIDND